MFVLKKFTKHQVEFMKVDYQKLINLKIKELKTLKVQIEANKSNTRKRNILKKQESLTFANLQMYLNIMKPMYGIK